MAPRTWFVMVLFLAACGGRAGDGPESPGSFRVAVSRNGNGSGTVTSAPAGIACGSSCEADFAEGTTVNLSAAPDALSGFAGWSGGGCSGTGSCTVLAGTVSAVSATFTLSRHALTVERAGSGSGTVASIPSGISCGTSCSGEWDHGTTVTLVATAEAGSTFTGWSGGGCSGTGSCAVSLTAAASVSAAFTLETYALSIVKGGNGSGMVTSVPPGVDCGTSCSASYDHGTSVTLTATAATGSTFTGWSGGGCGGTGMCTVPLTAATSVSATFTLDRTTLTVARAGTGSGAVTSDIGGIGCGTTCSAEYDYGTAVTLTAAPTVGTTFSGWSGGGCTGTGTCVTTMLASKTVTATFTLDAYVLTVARTGNGAGIVSANPAGVDCGSTCSASYDHGTSVTLTAVPAIGSTFTGWTGGGCSGTGTCTVSMTAAASVSAAFTLDTYALSVSKTGTGSGTVTASPAGVDCGTSCSASYDHGTSVTLAAAPAAGSSFAGWSGGGCSGTGACTVSMTAAASVSAAFTLDAYALTVSKTGNGSGTVASTPAGVDCGTTCSAQFDYGASVTLTPTATIGSTFAGWSGGGCTGTAPCVTTISGATAVSATFALNQYALTIARAGTGEGTVTSDVGGIDCGTTCAATYDHGAVVTLTAAPNATTSTFVGWSGGGCSGTGTCVTTLTGAAMVTATFPLKQYPITVATLGSGSGTILSTPPGINCPSLSCSATFEHGVPVTLTATAHQRSTFAGWSAGPCDGTGTCGLTPVGPSSVTATFTQPAFPASLKILQVTDPHYGLSANAAAFTSEAVTQATPWAPDLLALTGDLAQSAPVSTYVAYVDDFVSRFSIGVAAALYAPGNHDFDGTTLPEVRGAWPTGWLLEAQPDAFYGSFDLGAFHIVVLDAQYLVSTTTPTPHIENSNGGYTGYLPPEELNWLASDLAATTKPSIVFVHQEVGPFSPLGGGDEVTNRAEVRGVLEAAPRGVAAVVSGHVHCPDSQVYNGIPYITTSSLDPALAICPSYTNHDRGTHTQLTFDSAARTVVVENYENDSVAGYLMVHTSTFSW